MSESAALPALSARLSLKLPTGDAGESFGSGHPDVAMGLAAEKRVAERWLIHLNANGVLPTGHVGSLPVFPFVTALIAVEFLAGQDFSVVTQFDYYGTPYRHTGLKALDRG